MVSLLLEKLSYFALGVVVCIFILSMVPLNIVNSTFTQNLIVLVFGGFLGVALKTMFEYYSQKKTDDNRKRELAYSKLAGLSNFMYDLYCSFGYARIQFNYYSAHWESDKRPVNSTDISEIHFWRNHEHTSSVRLDDLIREMFEDFALLKVLFPNDNKLVMLIENVGFKKTFRFKDLRKLKDSDKLDVREAEYKRFQKHIRECILNPLLTLTHYLLVLLRRK